MAAKFSVSCEQCHTSDNWLTVKFDHTRFTGFALVGDACHAGLRQLPRGQPFRGHSGVLLRMPRQGIRGHHQSESRGGRYAHGLLPLSQLEQLAQFHLQSRHLGIPSYRRPRQYALRAMPREQPVRQHSHVVLGVSPERLPDGDQSESRRFGLPHHLRGMPQHFSLVAGHVQPQCDQVPAHRRARQHALHTMPRQQRLREYVDAVRRLPPGDLQHHHQSEPRHARRSPRIAPCAIPPRTGSTRCSTTTTRSSRWWAPTFRWPARPATPTDSSPPCPRLASRATWRLQRNQQSAACGLGISRRPARSATPLQPGRRPHSITAPPSSRSPGRTSTRPAQAATSNNVFAGTPTDCYSCHKTEYTTTNNPNHAASGFPTTCANCHTTTTWTGATFTHSQFPIYSGTHNKVWTSCGDCHTNSSNYQVFTCINCHTHTQAATDPHHGGVRSYVYAPTTCYSCHPTGSRGR